MARSPFSAFRTRRFRSLVPPRPLLNFVQLEDRSVPATISGVAFNDIDGSTTQNGGEPGLAGVTVFLDANNNGILDTGTATGNSADTPIPIPDSPGGPITSTIAIAGAGTVTDVNVTINITHTYNGDLQIFLISPIGTRVELSTSNGGSGENYINTVFDDEAATNITAGGAPFTGSFIPEQLLSTVDGENVAGNWQLEVRDAAGVDTGTLNSWSIEIGGGGGETNTVTNSSGAYSFTGLPAGTYNVREIAPPGFSVTTPASGVHTPTLSAVGSFTGNFANRRPGGSIYGNVFNDLDADGTIDGGEAGQSGIVIYADQNGNNILDVSSSTKTSTDVPIAISATGTPTITSTLNVAGLGNIFDLNVNLTISHTYDADVDIYLTSPAGTKVELSTDNGGSANNYINTTFDDEAAVSITTGSAPFTGSFQPEGLLAAFDGQSANGVWTLTVTDDTNTDGGSLDAWSLIITTPSEAFGVTDSSGDYFLAGLTAGTYTLKQQSPPPGQTQVFPVGGAAQVVTLATNQGKSGINFGNRAQPASISGLAFSDANKNGSKDSGEAVLPNVVVFLDTNQNGVLDGVEVSTTTDGNGNYTFASIAPGQNYFVAALEPVNYTLTAPIRNGLSVLPPVNTGVRSGDQNESTVAIDPNNPSRLFTASNTSTGGAALNASFSTDSGATWTNRLLPTGSDATSTACCDANTAWDKYGNLWMVYLTNNITTALARSTDGGATFTLVQDFGSSDHPSIAVGPSATVGQQTLAFQDRAGGGLRVVSMQINAAGVVGAIPAQQITPGSSSVGGNFGDIVIGPTGQVAVVYVNAGSGQGPDNLYFNLDPDGTGPAPFGAQSIITPTNVGGFDFLPAQPQRSVDAEPDLAWDTTGGPNHGRMYIVYNDEVINEGNDFEVFTRYSDNSGATWSPRIRVNDDGPGNAQFLPRVAMEPTTGNLAVSFYDTRDDAANTLTHYYAAASFDGGVTWTPNVRLTTGQSSAVGGGGNDYGDYNDIDYVQGRFVTTWADNSATADMDIFIGRVDVANNVKNHFIAGAVSGTNYAPLNFGFFTAVVPDAAKVTSAELNTGSVQRSRVTDLTVTFDQVVTAPVGAFTLTNQKTSIPVNLAITNVDTTGGFSKITFGFGGGSLDFGSLSDGRYTLGIAASQVSNANGLLDGDGNGSAGGDYSLVGNITNDFFRLFGDINGDGTVDGSTDFAQFGTVFGTSPGVGGSAFDFDNNGTIDGSVDFAQFGGRFGITI